MHHVIKEEKAKIIKNNEQNPIDREKMKGFNQISNNPLIQKMGEAMTEKVEEIKDESKYISHEDYLEAHFNIIQSHIVSFLQPIAHHHTISLVKAFLQIWSYRNKFDAIGMNINEGSKKIIELLLSLSLQPFKVIDAIQSFITGEGHVAVKQRSAKLNGESKGSATSQALYCHFVYNYLLHCISNHFQDSCNNQADGLIDIIPTERNHELLYQNMMKFFKCFIYSRSPLTVTWLLEILYILTNKFKHENQKIDKKVKADYLDVLDTLLKSATMIIQDTFAIEYFPDFGIN